MADVFVSYSRSDAEFVSRLAEDLKHRGKEVWVDVDGVRDAERFPEALRRAIEASDAFVFVISPDAVSSEFCEQEVAHAAGLNKRIVPLALRPVSDGQIPEEIRFRNWIPVGEDTGVDRVIAALETDLEWERQHTRVTLRALQWQQANRDRSVLLRGSELVDAERWLAEGAGKDPGPTALEQEYLLAARQAVSRRQRTLTAAVSGTLVVAVGLLVFALISRGQAISARNAAAAAARIAKSRALAAESQTQLSVDPERSILLAAAAVRTSATPQAMFALRAAIDASPIRFRLPDVAPQTCGPVTTANGPASPGVAFSPDGSQVAEALCDGTVVLADGKSGRVTRRVYLGHGLAGRLVYNRASSLLVAIGAGRVVAIDPASGAVRERGPAVVGFTGLASNPRAPVVAFAGKRGVTLWNLRTQAARTLSLPEGLTANMLAFSPDGRRVAVILDTTASDQPIVALVLDARTGRILAALHNYSGSLVCLDLAFSPDGRGLVFSQNDLGGGAIVLRDARNLALRRVLVRTENEPVAVAFSPHGSQIAYGAIDGTAALVDVASGQTIVSYPGQTAPISQAAFSPDGRLVMTGSSDGTVRVWRGQGLALRSAPITGGICCLIALGAGFASVVYGPSGITAQLWSAGLKPATKPLILWPANAPNAGTIPASSGPLAAIFPHGNIPPGGRGRILIWNILKRRVIRNVPTRFPGNAFLSPDGTTIAAALPVGGGWAIGLLDTRTGGYKTLGRTACPTPPVLAFSNDGRLVAAGGSCGQAEVWNVASGRRVGQPVTVGAATQIPGLAFSPDGRQLALAAADDTVTVINALTGATLVVLTDHTRAVGSAAYSPDGRYLATTSDDHTTDIYDAHTFTLLRVIHDRAAVDGAFFTPNGQNVITWEVIQRYATAAWVSAIAEWDACTDCENPAALLRLAQSRVTRWLTPAERKTYGVD